MEMFPLPPPRSHHMAAAAASAPGIVAPIWLLISYDMYKKPYHISFFLTEQDVEVAKAKHGGTIRKFFSLSGVDLSTL